MCVVERKTYIYSDNRRDVVESARRCHRAPNVGLCDFVEYKDISPARIMELRPSSSSGLPSSSRDVVTTDRSGRERRYREVTRRSSKKSSAGRTSRPSSSQYPMDSPTLPPSPTEPSYRETREIRPPAPSPPPVGSRPARPSGPRVSFSEPLDTNRTELSDGTAVYNIRESLVDRTPLERRSSISSLTNEVDESPLPQRRPSILRRTQPAGLNLNYGGPSNTTSASSSPGLSNLPRVGNFAQDSAADLLGDSQQRPRRPRVDSSLDDAHPDRRRQDDDRETQIPRDQRPRPNRRRPSRGAEDLPRIPRESSRERRRRHQREAQAALEGAQAAEDRANQIDPRVADELAQMERERRVKLARASRYSSQQQYPPEVSPSPTASRSSRSSYTSYAYTTSPVTPTRQLPSARQVTDTFAPITARAPRSYNVQVHNSTPAPSDSLAERGEQVIARERFRAVEEESRRMADMMGEMDLEAEEVDEPQIGAGASGIGIGRERSRREREETRRRRGYNN